MKRLFATTVFVFVAGFTSAQAPFAHITEPQARKMLADAIDAGKSGASVELTFMKSVVAVAPDFKQWPPTIFYSDAIHISLSGRVSPFWFFASERIRKMEPIGEVPWPTGFFVSVSPSQIGAPDIVKIVVTRDGVQIQPVADHLTARQFSTRMGAKSLIHAGDVFFPDAAFLPGARVVVTAIPESGNNIVKTLTDEELKGLQ